MIDEILTIMALMSTSIIALVALSKSLVTLSKSIDLRTQLGMEIPGGQKEIDDAVLNKQIVELKKRYDIPQKIQSESDAQIFQEKLSAISSGKLIGSEAEEKLTSELSEFKKQKKYPKIQGTKLTISYPETFAKGYESSLNIYIYLSQLQEKVDREIEKFTNKSSESYLTNLKPGREIKLELYSQVLSFSEEGKKVLKLDDYTRTIFNCMPKDSCREGLHEALLVISNPKNGYEYFSESFEVRITDYVVGKVSRPLASNITTAIVGIPSITLLALGQYGIINQLLGVGSAIMGIVICILLIKNFSLPFKRIQNKDVF